MSCATMGHPRAHGATMPITLGQLALLVLILFSAGGTLFWFAYNPVARIARSSPDPVHRWSVEALLILVSTLSLYSAILLAEGFIGIDLPLVPTAVFLIVAVLIWCNLSRPPRRG